MAVLTQSEQAIAEVIYASLRETTRCTSGEARRAATSAARSIVANIDELAPRAALAPTPSETLAPADEAHPPVVHEAMKFLADKAQKHRGVAAVGTVLEYLLKKVK
jgi:hypothetical protein